MFDPGAVRGWHYYWRSCELPALKDDMIDVIAERSATVSSPRSYALMFHLGGAVSRVPEDAMAYSHRQVLHNININGVWLPEDNIAEAETPSELWAEVEGFAGIEHDGGAPAYCCAPERRSTEQPGLPAVGWTASRLRWALLESASSNSIGVVIEMACMACSLQRLLHWRGCESGDLGVNRSRAGASNRKRIDLSAAERVTARSRHQGDVQVVETRFGLLGHQFVVDGEQPGDSPHQISSHLGVIWVADRSGEVSPHHRGRH